MTVLSDSLSIELKIKFAINNISCYPSPYYYPPQSYQPQIYQNNMYPNMSTINNPKF